LLLRGDLEGVFECIKFGIRLLLESGRLGVAVYGEVGFELLVKFREALGLAEGNFFICRRERGLSGCLDPLSKVVVSGSCISGDATAEFIVDGVTFSAHPFMDMVVSVEKGAVKWAGDQHGDH
jgi:hypothetical protein